VPWIKIQPEKRSKDELKPFVGRPRFYCDHDISASIAAFLRKRKYDVETARDISAEQQPDEFHFKRAFKSKRVLLTRDNDYIDSVKFPLSQTHGVVILNVDMGQPSHVSRALEVVDVILGAIGPALSETKMIINSDYTVTMIDRGHPAGGFIERRIRFRLDENGKDVWCWRDRDAGGAA
jgi:predicted nuclease of predicted toxin-antitoxin system